MTGKVAIVTGANSGLGYETARALVAKGAQVTIACRNLDKGEAARGQMAREHPQAPVELMRLDLADLASVGSFAKDYARRHNQLDLLINNAGVMGIAERRLTADGFEMHFGTNHLGHFALTGRLFELIQSTPGARVVTVSSSTHRLAKIDFDNLNAQRNYRRWWAYGLSKLANLSFTYELQRRLEGAELDVMAVAAHPGYAATNLQAHSALFRLLNRFLAQAQEMGALPTLHAATAPDVQGGDFFGPDGFLEQRGYPRKVKSSTASYDEETAERLWQVSQEMTGVCYL